MQSICIAPSTIKVSLGAFQRQKPRAGTSRMLGGAGAYEPLRAPTTHQSRTKTSGETGTIQSKKNTYA